MNILPFDPKLPIQNLAACFNSTSATYKFYWLLAILDTVKQQQRVIKKDQLFASMISQAWYTVNYYHVSFGPQDKIQITVQLLKDQEGIRIDEQRDTIQHILLNTNNPETRKLLYHFDNQVPHWFLSPWYPRKGKSDIYKQSQQNSNTPLYELHKNHIVLNEQWFEYLTQHIRFITDFVYWNLSLFLQIRNPNVPDIVNKLIKPAIRNSLHKQHQFWDYVIDKNGPIPCIYSGKLLYKGEYHVDHFIPHSFVSHDQIWNLIPADSSFNLIKSNKLPTLEKYFEAFYKLQAMAVNTYIRHGEHNKLLDEYFYIGSTPKEGISRKQFYDVIYPLVTIASNNGFTFLK